ncbi:MAG: carbohydrate binding domain-containing protein [Phycisphaeraceae bacterium]|nr:carbohydrate binding domain-containing protein [Phycisphaeraceae bacterium]
MRHFILRTVIAFVFALPMITTASLVKAQIVGELSIDTMLYDSPDKAATRWTPALAALTPKPETVDGVECLTLPCNFRTWTQRASWDKAVNLDLSQYNYLYFRFKCPNISAIDKISIYFKSGDKGWYVCHAAVPLLTDQWQTVLIPQAMFRAEGKPSGWTDINKVLISVWQNKTVATSVSIADLRMQQINVVNLVNNSGFEACSTERLPDYWGPGHWGLQQDHWISDMDTWRAAWGIDNSVSYQGARSLRLAKLTDTAKRAAVSTFFRVLQKQPYIFSAWLKSDQPNGQKVTFKTYTLKNTWLNKTVTVTNTWKRYEVSFTPRKTSSQTRCQIGPASHGVLWVDNVQVEKGTVATAYQTAPKDLIITGHAVQNNEPAVADYAITPDTSKGVVSIDANRRFLVDGKPFIPTTVGWEGTPSPSVINDLARSGFNTLCFTANPPQTVASLHATMDDARANGLKVILWIGKKVTDAQVTQWVNGLKNHPALIAWYVYDEPGGLPTSPSWEKANARYKLVKSLDASHPAYTNILFRELKGDYLSDILCIDYYPLTFWSPSTVSTYARKLDNIAAKAGKPSWIWLQNSGNAYFIFREPTDAEVQCMTYLALIHGSKAIKYFAHKSLGKGLWNEMRKLTGEIRKLTPILYSLEPQPNVNTNSPSINLVGKTYNGKKYIIAVNDPPSSVNATIKISSSGKFATVLFESRTVNIKGNQIKDTFKPYQRHVYKIGN